VGHYPIDNSDVPIRLFKSDFLEFFSHISPIAIIIIWSPVIIFFFYRSIIIRPAGGSLWHIPAGFVIGLFLWTLAEYTLHRFVFHFQAKSPRGQRITFLFHGIHHAQPQCKTRLVMPPAVGIPLAALFYGLFYLVTVVLMKTPYWINPLFSAFLTGYLIYDLGHYAQHHLPMRRGYFRYIKRYHMQHHYKTPNQRFGVSSPIWDFVFGTHPN
jgi:sterol desaturase/sphingolipid hydroxylase (fatty acid hydroxylase superfamily)